MQQEKARRGGIAAVLILLMPFWACGPDSDSVRSSLSIIEEKSRKREYKEAGELARALLRRLDESGRGESPEAAETIDFLRGAAWNVNRCGDPDAVGLCLRAIRLREKLGDDLKLAVSLTHYANCLGPGKGDYRAAKPHYERVLAIREKTIDPSDPLLARSLNNLAAVNGELGDYAAARPLMERVLSLTEKTLGPTHRDTGVAHFNLGVLLEYLGDYEAAREHYEWILSNQVNDPDDADTGGVLVRLGFVLNEMGDPRGAEQLYRRALGIYERVQGRGKDVVWVLFSLGRLRLESGDLEGAFRLMDRAHEIGRKLPSPNKAEAAPHLVLLAEVLTERGEVKRAAELFEEALSVQSSLFGPEGRHLAWGLAGYSRLQYKQGQSTAAVDHALRAETIARTHFQETARGLSEREALRYEKVRATGMDVALSVLAARSLDQPADLVDRAWDAIIRSRALVLDEMAGRHRNLLKARTPEMETLFSELDAARNRLASLAANPPQEAQFQAHRKRIEEARRDAERMERAVGEKSSEFRQRIAERDIGLAEVVASLPAGSALVSYVLHGRPALTGRRRSPRSSYGAFVAVGGTKKPTFVSIGDAPAIDALIERWRRIVSSPPPPILLAGRRTERDSEIGNRLRRLLWDALPEQARRARKVFIVPDGAIHLVSFGALPDGGGSRLVDSGPLLHYLSAERDLARPARGTPQGMGVLVMGAPTFGDGEAACLQKEAPASWPSLPPQKSLAAAQFPVVRGGAMKFRPIPASRDEAREVAGMLKRRFGSEKTSGPSLLLGPEATEEAFKRLAAKQRVIHLATHAFVAGEEGENPFQLSGLALAGANDRRCRATRGLEDGLLMADEITSQDLSGAEWVVLSACETGLGPIQAGEGVQGLRRAFEIAGARTLVMSLWAMDDQATRDWMKSLYQSRLAGASWPEALRGASLSHIASRRQAGLSTDPFYWGSFVATGDWR